MLIPHDGFGDLSRPPLPSSKNNHTRLPLEVNPILNNSTVGMTGFEPATSCSEGLKVLRTCGQLNPLEFKPKQARYQAAPHPEG